MYHIIDHEQPETKFHRYLFSGFINCFVNLQSLKYINIKKIENMYR